jgi:hypothetical protein
MALELSMMVLHHFVMMTNLFMLMLDLMLVLPHLLMIPCHFMTGIFEIYIVIRYGILRLGDTCDQKTGSNEYCKSGFHDYAFLNCYEQCARI